MILVETVYWEGEKISQKVVYNRNIINYNKTVNIAIIIICIK